jgi:hypothetical protein
VENAQIRGNLLPFDNFHLATTPDKRAAIAPPSTLRKLRISSDTFQVGSRRRADSMDSFLCGRRFERQYASQAHVRALEPHPPPPLSMQFTTAEPQLLVASLGSSAHDDHILIVWWHGKIPALLQAQGRIGGNRKCPMRSSTG